jgi:hypothetical protein
VPSVNLKIGSNLTTSDDEYTFDGVDVLPGYVGFPSAFPSTYAIFCLHTKTNDMNTHPAPKQPD